MAGLPEYLSVRPSKDRIVKSRKQEKRVSREYDGRSVAGSGSGREKGDVNVGNIGDGYKVEAKRTEKDSISLKRRWLEKISEEAFSAGRKPLIEIEFEANDRGESEQWVLLEKREFLAIREYV